ncbi:carbohydrate ABC transporter permease [Propionibacteriaceae bacterium Y2011]
MEKPSIGARALKGVVLLVAVALVIIPFLMVVATSLADQRQIADAGGYVLWPTAPSLDAYITLLSGQLVPRALLVSLGVTVVGTLIAVAATTTLAYSLSRPGSWGHRPILFGVLLTMLLSPGMIPLYLTIKELGLINSYWSLILPPAVTAFQVIIVRGFFLEIPGEIIDAARVDGASEWRIFLTIVLPLSKAVVAVIGLFSAVQYWNAFFNAMLYLNDNEKWPIQLVLRTFVVDNATIDASGATDLGIAAPPTQALQMAIVVVSMLPIVVVYPFLQRHFAKGMMIGAVKG